MKKFNYLFSLFFLLEGSLYKRLQILNEINESLIQRINAGSTISEAIDSVGHVYEIVRAYNEVNNPSRIKQRWYLVFYIIIGTVLVIFIISDFIVIKNGTFTINIMASSNSSIFMTSKSNIYVMIIKFIIEWILLLQVVKKIIKYYIYHKTK